AVSVPVRPETLELTGIEVGREGTRLILVPFPGPARPDDILRNGDQRFVSVRLGDPILVTAPPLSL
ncbi:MAG TPA: hypothetical protein VMS64_33535, partial [Candidatus Methylomirabilis sp.]|nr:hypothetical protein [Candidatus Methylomirabilis sp.]